jgi:chromosome segregation ATPase
MEIAARAAELEQQRAELYQLKADVEEHHVVLKIQRDRLETERSELGELRASVVAEEARIAELATHIDSKAAALESADQERAQAGAHLAQQLAALAERERELKRERAASELVREEQEERFVSRENALRELDGATLRRQQEVAQQVVALKGSEAELQRERGRLGELSETLAQRETAFVKKLEAREKMLANGESALAAWEGRLREQSDRLERERAGHGHASQEAFALLAELEQREARVSDRETRLVDAEDGVASRSGELGKSWEELKLREARLLADLELREDKLEARERNLGEREELMEFRERDLTAYVGQLQDRLGEVA